MRALAYVRKALYVAATTLRGREPEEDRRLAVLLGSAMNRLDGFDDLMAQHFQRATAVTPMTEERQQWLLDLCTPTAGSTIASSSIPEPTNRTEKISSLPHHVLSEEERKVIISDLARAGYQCWADHNGIDVPWEMIDAQENREWQLVVRAILRTLFLSTHRQN